MGYKSRKKYTSRREKFQETVRNTRIIIIFMVIGIALFVFMKRREYWAWLETYFY